MNLHDLVTQGMSHVPCSGEDKVNGRNCVRRGPCSAKMPKKIQEYTDSELDSFARYRRRDIYHHDNRTYQMPYGTKKIGKGTGFQSVKITNEW